MSLLVHIYYTGRESAAQRFSEEMTASGIVEQIRAEVGNLRDEHYYSTETPETMLLIDEWRDRTAPDTHHRSEMMQRIAALREIQTENACGKIYFGKVRK